MTHRGARLSLLTAAMVAGVVVPAVGAPAAFAAPAASPSGPTVTLLTGDKVTIGGLRGVTVQAAKGRESVDFFARKDVDGDMHVVPSDAQILLARGKLDPRLFDVTELARIGYDDAHRDKLPLIVDYAGSKTPRVAGAQVSRELPAMSAAAVSADRSADFWATAKTADHVWLDGPVKASLDYSVPQIGAPEAWAAGYTGAGTTVAVLDTGIDATHPDLSDAVTDAQNFTDSDTTDDRFGHGTHVASIITGSGAASGGKYTGVAPDAKLLNGKVLNDDGGGFDSWIIAGMEWAAHKADVVNMSLGANFPSDGTDPMSQAVNRLTAETGALFVIASGNSGGQIGSPGAADAALTVGAVDRNDKLAGFSSRGRVDGAIKPDITAPGVDIVAAKAANGRIGEPAADGYVKLSGTSMATPHVAGAAAILAGEHPDWTANQLKNTLMGTAKPGDYSIFEQGAGRVDVAKAFASTVYASVGSVSLGTVQWPHTDDQPIPTTVTYTNTGTTPVTLDLAADIKDPNGSAAPQGMFTVSPAQLTVPAGGQATATVTTNTTVDGADGVYSGVVTATGAGQSVRTPLTVTREVESYNVTVKSIDLNGAPGGVFYASFVDLNVQRGYGASDESGTAVVRIPKGEFYLDGMVQTEVSQYHYRNAQFAEPSVTIDGDRTIVLDAREAKPVAFIVDKPNAKVGDALYQLVRKTAWGDIGSTSFIGSYDDFLFKPSTTPKKDQLTFVAEARMGEWNGTSFDGSPYLYFVRHTENGGIPQNLRWTFHDRDLAKVRSEHAAATPGLVGVRERFLVLPLPATLTEYYTPNEEWDGTFAESTGLYDSPLAFVEQIDARSFRLGRTTTERWNYGVYGISFPNGERGIPEPWYYAARWGDQFNFQLPLATDQGRGRMGFAAGDGPTTLLRDGKVVAESPYPGGLRYTVDDPARVEYTLRTSADRAPYGARFSTQISAEWTFASGRVDGDLPANLPLLAVRFAPNLDDHNAAPAGKRFTIPVYVQRNGSDTVGKVNTPTVDVSYDDGKTWAPAKVTCDGKDYKATVDHPAGAQFVSLRSKIVDADGHTASQTIIRAYALK